MSEPGVNSRSSTVDRDPITRDLQKARVSANVGPIL